jgi:hypothetical protein
VDLRLDPGGRRPVINLSGDRCWLDLAPGAYVLRASPEDGLPISQAVTLPMPDPRSPLLTVAFRPGPSYPFAAGVTMLRGVVQTPDRKPAAGAAVEVLGGGPSSRTAESGEFVLAWPPLRSDQVLTERRNGTTSRYVRGDQGAKRVRVRIVHPSYRAAQEAVPELAEGTIRSMGVLTLQPL